MEDAGLVATAASALTALLGWITIRLRAGIKKTTDEAAGVIDWPKLRGEVDSLIKFRKDLEEEREERAEVERLELISKVEELELELRQREVEDSAATRSGVRTQPLRRGK